MVLNIGVFLVCRTARKCAELRGRHAHRASLAQCVFKPDAGFSQKGVGHGIERQAPGAFTLQALDFVDRSNLKMVLQVCAYTGQVLHNRNAVLLQKRCRANT